MNADITERIVREFQDLMVVRRRIMQLIARLSRALSDNSLDSRKTRMDNSLDTLKELHPQIIERLEREGYDVTDDVRPEGMRARPDGD